MIAYITTQGAKITREGTRLIVTSPDTRHILFSDVLEQLLLFGNVTLTAPATFLLLKKNIDTVFFRMDGRYMGRLVQTESAHVLLHKKQFLLTDNKRRRRVAAYLEEKGLRTQKSIFECEMDTQLLRTVRQYLENCIDSVTDSVLFYPVCKRCTHDVTVIGQGIALIKTNWMVI